MLITLGTYMYRVKGVTIMALGESKLNGRPGGKFRL